MPGYARGLHPPPLAAQQCTARSSGKRPQMPRAAHVRVALALAAYSPSCHRDCQMQNPLSRLRASAVKPIHANLCSYHLVARHSKPNRHPMSDHSAQHAPAATRKQSVVSHLLRQQPALGAASSFFIRSPTHFVAEYAAWFRSLLCTCCVSRLCSKKSPESPVRAWGGARCGKSH